MIPVSQFGSLKMRSMYIKYTHQFPEILKASFPNDEYVRPEKDAFIIKTQVQLSRVVKSLFQDLGFQIKQPEC
jgi:hypothetical protein